MPIGIRPINDFAFKKVFGTPGNKPILVSLLNAILQFPQPITDVIIENPFNPRDFEDDKLSILDLRVVDGLGQIYGVEIQLAPVQGLIERLVFYGCELYAGQLKNGQGYGQLKPVFVICLLEGCLWKDTARVHHAFRMMDKESGRTLDNSLAIHTLELGKYNLGEMDLSQASLLDCWLFWMIHAQDYDEAALNRLFSQDPIRQATRVIQKISEMTEDKAMYDSREKANRDRQWLQEAMVQAQEDLAKAKEGLAQAKEDLAQAKEGLAQAHKGLALAQMEGEANGRKKGEIRLIHFLQDSLGMKRTPDNQLLDKSLEQLEAITEDLRAKSEEFRKEP